MGPEERANKVRYLSPAREKCFAKLNREDYRVTSDEDFDYNCIAYAAGVTHTRWWPPVDEDIEGVDWPEEAPPEETVEAFVVAFGTKGYLPCDNAHPEEGYEKIAIYADSEGVPTHAARQVMPAGEWTSKLGGREDIRHRTLAALEGAEPAYGEAVRFLRRKIVERK